ATTEDLEAMRQAALDLGASTSKSATEVAAGMELMAAKGFEANEVIAAMPGVIAAAEASGEDMALVADTVASALNAFGLEAKDASRVADVLAM
ncbi:phage tail tape measure protein, partial [Escherichia coli]